jgi:H/ACA ribonucleoprotein complex subunit 2
LFLQERLTETRIVIIAGDISPIDVISHVPVLCEEADVPYAYVPSKEELGQAGSTKRPTSVVMIVPGKEGDFKEAYDEIRKEFKEVCIYWKRSNAPIVRFRHRRGEIKLVTFVF